MNAVIKAIKKRRSVRFYGSGDISLAGLSRANRSGTHARFISAGGASSLSRFPYIDRPTFLTDNQCSIW